MARAAALVLVLAAALAAALPAGAGEGAPSQADLEDELVCPTCGTTLDQSDAPIAERMKRFVSARIAAGDTKGEIKDKLVAQFGRGVLAVPPKRGFDLLAWLLPLGAAAAGAVAVGVLAWRWSRAREPLRPPAADPSANGRAPLDPELERRLDDALAKFE
jgi:cytochrome c-type biogenesis protein CcmH